MAAELIPAAQYLRMSTEHQQYSLDNQQFVIQSYAEAHGFSVVQTYPDGARSGVDLKRREALRRLLQDVMSGSHVYKAILVYDISRWGRFQDADEAAHYEFLCKSAGVPIHYCAEVFVNDGTMANMLLKALKRTMAGEYSRELGVRVLAGLKRLAGLGYKQGGSAGYGLSRMLVSADGKPKVRLAPGEYKSIATDRVILVPGPVDEVECVKEIYRMFIEEKRTVNGVAQELNRTKIRYTGNSKWNYNAVHNILTHPKYAGCNVYGRTSQRLGTATVRICEKEWIRTLGAFTPLVDWETFQEAQQLLLGRTINKSDEELLEALRSLLAREGRLSARLIKGAPETPSSSVYRERFGSVRRAYELIGYDRPDCFSPIDLRRRRQAMREDLLCRLQAMFPNEISIERRGGRWRSYLRLEEGSKIAIVVSHSIGTTSKGLVWQISPTEREQLYVTLLALLNGDNSAIQATYVFPYLNRIRRFRVTADSTWLKGGVCLSPLSHFLEAVRFASQQKH